MKGIAPGRSREFAAESFAFIDKKVWKNAREEAFDLEHPTEFQAFATDIETIKKIQKTAVFFIYFPFHDTIIAKNIYTRQQSSYCIFIFLPSPSLLSSWGRISAQTNAPQDPGYYSNLSLLRRHVLSRLSLIFVTPAQAGVGL